MQSNTIRSSSQYVQWWSTVRTMRNLSKTAEAAIHQAHATPEWCPGAYVCMYDSRLCYHIIPGHALHEKGLQRQKNVGPLVSSQEQRALLVPRLNRSSTGDFVPAFGLNRISFVRVSGETFRQYVLDALEGTRKACFLGGLFCRRPVLTDPAPSPRRALRPDPPVVCSSFGLDKSRLLSVILYCPPLYHIIFNYLGPIILYCITLCDIMLGQPLFSSV